jgi:hypothetical protein
MGRNLYILAATLGFFAVVSFVLSVSGVAHQFGSPGDAALWRMTSITLILISLVVALLGVLSALFEQAERRAAEDRRQKRQR